MPFHNKKPPIIRQIILRLNQIEIPLQTRDSKINSLPSRIR